MLKKAPLLLIFSSLFSQSATVRPDDSPKPYEDGEAYAVYSAILPSEWPWSVAHAKTLVIRSETKNYEMCLQPEKGSEQSLGAAISNYVELNRRPWMLQSRFDIEKPYLLITPEELKSAFAQGNWEAFYRQYPDSGGFVELSAVGFNSDKTVAVVYMGHGCGMLCGGGHFHVLQKKDGKWIPLDWKGASCAWTS